MQPLVGLNHSIAGSVKLTGTARGLDQNNNHSMEQPTVAWSEALVKTTPDLSHIPDGVLDSSTIDDVTFLSQSTNTPLQEISHNDTGQRRHLLRQAGLLQSALLNNRTRNNTLVSSTQAYCNGSKALLIPSTAQYMAGIDASRNVTTYNSGLDVSPVDVVIVTAILITWFFVIGLFIHKWQHLRIVEPREYRFQHKPKNLDSIKIVKRQSDSVIYRAYPDAMTRTMAARKKRFERMHTMPAIKVDLTAKSPAHKVRRELEEHIPILCLQTMGDLENVLDEDSNERDKMLRPIEV